MKRVTKLSGMVTVGVLALGILGLSGTTARACHVPCKGGTTYAAPAPNANTNLTAVNRNGNTNRNQGNTNRKPVNNKRNTNGNGNNRG
jgi:hypothetical protein